MKLKRLGITFTALVLIGVGQLLWSQNKTVSPVKYGNTTEGFKLSAQLDKKEYQAASPVVVTLRLQNTNTKSISAYKTNTDIDFEVEVKDERGYKMPATLYGQGLDVAIIRNRHQVEYEPGQEKTYKLVISRIADLSLLGTYTAVIKRNVPKINGQGYSQVESNPVTIKVLATTSTETSD